MFGLGTQTPTPRVPENGVPGSMQPKMCVVCLGLDVAVGWGFTGVWNLQLVLKMHQAKPGIPAGFPTVPSNWKATDCFL